MDHGPTPPDRFLDFRRSAVRHDPDGFWVAEAAGDVIGFGIAVQRAHVWYLAGAPRPAGVPGPWHRCRAGPAHLGARSARQPADGGRRCAESDLQRAVRAVRDVPLDDAARAERAHATGDRAGPAPARSPTLRRRRISRGSTALVLDAPRPEDHAFWSRRRPSTATRCAWETAWRATCTSRPMAPSGRSPSSIPAGPRPPSTSRSAGAASLGATTARVRIPGVARSAIADLLARGWRYGDGPTLVLTLGAVGPLGGLRHLRRGRAPVSGLDVILRGARIVDGSGGPAVDGDIGDRGRPARVVGGRSPDGTAAAEVDPAGSSSPPGFIDLHTHSDVSLLSPIRAASARSSRAITTQAVGLCGFSAGPCRRRPSADGRRGAGLRVPGRGLGLDDDRRLSRGRGRARPATNVTTFVGHNTLRRLVSGRRPAAEAAELERCAGSSAGHRRGGTRLHDGLSYAPGLFASVEELAALAGVAGEARAHIPHPHAVRRPDVRGRSTRRSRRRGGPA